MNKQELKNAKRIRRHKRVRAKVKGSESRPRLAVFRANQNIYAQIIDDASGKVLAAASSLEIKSKSGKSDKAALVGTLIAKKASEKNIKEVVFDRGGYKYHGRVKALAEAARQAGLQF
ncbi:50S ribosomal protein L18 [Patescibacteria group bacterium]|nr:50S ribosomal protein L18 [Patescibacteria group bacterium]